MINLRECETKDVVGGQDTGELQTGHSITFRHNFLAVIISLVLFSGYNFDSVKACGFEISR